MTTRDDLTARVQRLSLELGELVEEVTVVGGTSPALYQMNEAVSVRPTTDIDLIVKTTSPASWLKFKSELEERGFIYPAGEPICRYKKGELVVDVMPTDANQLGFGNRWYELAARHRVAARVGPLHVISPVYFLATKLDAFRSRGATSPDTSHDLEDIFVVLRGIPSLFGEIASGSDEVYIDVRRQLGLFAERPDALDIVRALVEADAATQATAPSLLDNLRRACTLDESA
jgi:hypothetical protein